MTAKKRISFAALGCTLAITAMGLTACSKPVAAPKPHTAWVYTQAPSQKAVRNGVFKDLRAAGAQVFVQGESVKIILPNSDIFAVNSANLLPDAAPMLSAVAKAVKTYSIVGLNVKAYSDTTPWAGAPRDRKLALTNSQAQAVGSFLWSQGIDSRLMTASGCSSGSPVAWNGTPKGRSDNQRVEITFRFYPHLVEYN